MKSSICRPTCSTVSRSAWSRAVRSAWATITGRCGWVRAMCSTIGSTVVMPAPALASSSGPSDDSTTKSPAGRAHVQDVADGDLVVQERRHPAVRRAVHAADPSHGDLQPRAHGRRGDRVLARLALAVGQVDEHRHVLTRRDRGQPAPVGRLEHERDDVGRLLDAADHAVRPQRARRVHPRLLVEPGLLGDELGREQPVDLVPGGGDLGGDRLAEHLTDRGEQVVADDRVLLGRIPSDTCL